MPSSYHRRWRRPFAAVLGLGSAALLAICGSIGAAESLAEASRQSQKLEHLRDVNADARRNADQLRVQVDDLQAEATDGGLLLTLDDALFVTNDIGLSSTGRHRLDSLARFLAQHPARTVAVNGYAGTGEYRYDQALSKRRADAVKSYLIERGIPPRRLTARTHDQAVQTSVGSRAGQQSPRRVEVLIVDPFTSPPQSDVTTPGT